MVSFLTVDNGQPSLFLARWLSCLHCSLTARRSWVRFPHWALLALGGRSSPDLQCSGGLSPGPFCVEFACSPRVHKGFPPHRTPTQKHANRKRSLSCPVPDHDWTEHLAWSPCAVKGCPLLLEPLEEGQGLQDGLKAEGKFHRRPHQHACVCVLCRRQMHVCGVVCCVTIKQTLTLIGHIQ